LLEKFGKPFLVLAATNDRRLNRMLVEKGRSLGAFVYAADDPEVSDFSYASIINVQGVIQIAISTSGRSPIVARKLRIRAERLLRNLVKGPDIENARLQEFARRAARTEIKQISERKAFLYSLLKNSNIQKLIKEGRTEDAKSATLQLLQRWATRK
jgi:precorrin-2 dehydrogenase/sirohydrochlorin ferrochelatase